MAKLTAKGIVKSLSSLVANAVRTGHRGSLQLPNEQGTLEAFLVSRSGGINKVRVRITIKAPGKLDAASERTFDDTSAQVRKQELGAVARLVLEKLHSDGRHGVPTPNKKRERRKARAAVQKEAAFATSDE